MSKTLAAVIGIALAGTTAHAADPLVATDLVQNLNGTGFCFTKVMGLNKPEDGAGYVDTPVRGTNKRVKCALRVSTEADGVVPSIGTCADPNAPEMHRPLTDEEVESRWKDKKRDWTPFHDRMSFGDTGGGSVVQLLPTSKDGKRFLTDAEIAEYLAYQDDVKNKKVKKTDKRIKKWKGVAHANLPERRYDEKERRYKVVPTERYYIANAQTQLAIKIRDPKFHDQVTAFVCTSTKKDFHVDQMTIGDLMEAFGGRLRIDGYASTETNPKPVPTVLPTGTARMVDPSLPVRTKAGSGN